VAIRVEYEVVVSESALLRLLDRQALQVTGMRQLSVERMDVQSLARELRLQHADMQDLVRTAELQRLAEQLSNLSREVQRLAGNTERNDTATQSALQQLLQGIDQLARRGLWSRIRRVIRRGK
jgi:chromosome segregation ATPase